MIKRRYPKRRLIGTTEMVAALRELCAMGTPLYRCAERIGIGYPQAVSKARELGLAARLNHGRRSGEESKRATREGRR